MIATTQEVRDEAPKLIFICAPLRGNVSKNIEDAISYARAVFLGGDIPICPHLMFPQIAYVHDPDEDKAAMEMCLSLVRKCDQLNQYADPPSPGMLPEIEAAKQARIPIEIKTPLKEPIKQKPQQSPCR